jgi:hypothetical protein
MPNRLIAALIPAVREDIIEGGIRLARLLDDALGPEARAPGQKHWSRFPLHQRQLESEAVPR